MAICSTITWSKQIGCAKPHVIISNVEHVATTEPLKRLALMDEIGRCIINVLSNYSARNIGV